MSHAAGESLSSLLRDAIASGSYGPLGEQLAADAVLDTSNETGRRLIRGRDAIVAHLEQPGPGEVAFWNAREWPGGVALTFEWRGGSGVDRRRWYVRRAGGLVERIWSYAARSSDDPPAELSGEVLERLGAGARRAALDHSGNSGAALERVTLGDGTKLIAKRVGRRPTGSDASPATGAGPPCSGRPAPSPACPRRSITGSRPSSPTATRGGC